MQICGSIINVVVALIIYLRIFLSSVCPMVFFVPSKALKQLNTYRVTKVQVSGIMLLSIIFININILRSVIPIMHSLPLDMSHG